MGLKIGIQGFPGCFHQEAAESYFGPEGLEVVPADSFIRLAEDLKSHTEIDFAMMAIENNIAGSILQNYRILRDYRFRIIGEIYLPIHHCLMCLPGQSIEDITEVHSHPMALNQCLQFLSKLPAIKMIESEDTALSALRIRENAITGVAAIGSASAAALYELEVLAKNIETSPNNYTRFFALQRDNAPIPLGDFNKASIYLKTNHNKGSLLKVLEVIYSHNINLSKLQSFPVEGIRDAYYFYLDLEYEQAEDYEAAMAGLEIHTLELEVLGVYKKSSI